MFGLKFIKADPSTHLIQFRNGQIVREGAGLSFFYYGPSTSLVSVPLASEDVGFIFEELTSDFQQVTVQGQLTCRVLDVHALTSMLNYSLDKRGRYVSEDPLKMKQKLVNLAQVCTRKELAALTLKEALPAADKIASSIKKDLAASELLASLGVEVAALTIVAVKPNQETARALEAETREILLRQADEAIYLRRNAAIEQERIIKENELNTEAAIETKKREIMERKMEAKRAEQEKRQEIKEAEMAGQIVLQKQNEELVRLTAENSKKESDARAYGFEAILEPLRRTDPKIVQALAARDMDSGQLIALSFKELAEQAEKIGQLNISPDLLGKLLGERYEQAD